MLRASMLALVILATPLLAQEKALRLEKSPDKVTVFDGSVPFTTYVHGGTVQVEKGEGQKPLAKPFCYPLFAPNGAPVTRAWPMARGQAGETTDHFHQKSLWFCHGDVIPEGLTLKVRSADKHVKGVDFWSEAPGHGRIVCISVGEPKKHSDTHVSLETKNDWKAPDGTTIMTEARVLHFEKLPQGRLITFEITLSASEYPITFGDTKEGAMGVRVHDAIRAQQKGPAGVLANALGKKTEKEIWGYESDWCDYIGSVDGKPVGVSLFDHPSNKHRSAWHARGYGLMAANPFGRKGAGFPGRKDNTDLVKLAKGESLNLKYGVYAHDGDTLAGQVAETYKHFSK
jgi:hypothetical protein